MRENIYVKSDDEYLTAVHLFNQYASWLNIDLAFQNFNEEVLHLHRVYEPGSGGIILCKTEKGYAGCIAVRKIDDEVAELKRMFVKPEFQKQGIGQSLLEEALLLAQNKNYKLIRLDTLSNMTPAITLYRKYGFYEIPPYYFNPEETAVFFEKKL